MHLIASRRVAIGPRGIELDGKALAQPLNLNAEGILDGPTAV